MSDGRELLEMIERDPATAWRLLVDEYSQLILAVIGRYNPDPDARMDAYLFVLEQLASNNMHRIRRYGRADVTRHCRFSTWLKLVVRNLYFDWFRHRHGRKSVPKEVQKLGPREQAIFKLVYWEGFTPREAFEVLRSHDSRVTYPAFLDCLSEIDSRLTGINRAKIHRDFLQAVGPMSLDMESESRPPLEARAETDCTLPDEEVEIEQQRTALWGLLASLPAEERLLIRLRYYEGLTARQIAAVLGRPDPMEVYRRLERVAGRLARLARATGLEETLLEADPRLLADSGLPDVLAAGGGAGTSGAAGRRNSRRALRPRREGEPGSGSAGEKETRGEPETRAEPESGSGEERETGAEGGPGSPGAGVDRVLPPGTTA